MKFARQSLRPVLLVLLASVFVLGCQEKGESTTPQPVDRPAPVGDEYVEERTLPNDRPRTGWRWKGSRGKCYFLVGNQCFDNRDAACGAAGCAGDSCQVNDSIPAGVSCQ